MTLQLTIAEKLLLLLQGQQLPASKLKHALVDELKEEGIIQERLSGRTKSTLFITDATAFNNWLYNRFSIPDLQGYITAVTNETATRADLVAISSDSKAAARRTFKGFLVNSYIPIEGTLNGQPFIIHPTQGTFQFVYDFEQFIPAPGVVIIGVENAENFRFIYKQQHLFAGIKPLIISRYPQEQSKDVMKWLLSIPNDYLHFGDYDFAGINIYMQEYKKHLGERASFFIPPGIEQLLEKYGNRKLYDLQHLNASPITEEPLKHLIALIHKHKKGLEQESLLIT
jgi:hypothetical protein